MQRGNEKETRPKQPRGPPQEDEEPSELHPVFGTERVLVVARQELFAPPRGPVQGFLPDSGADFLEVARRRGCFLPRAQAESDPRYKQMIPYGVLFCGERVFVMKRSSSGREARLRDKVSLGVGGHVNPEDLQGGRGQETSADAGAAIEAAFRREIDEELCIESPFSTQVAGVINDEADAVGAVHFGIVYRVEVEEPRVRVREKTALRGEFVPGGGIGRYRGSMESWSRILLDHFWRVRGAWGSGRPRNE